MTVGKWFPDTRGASAAEYTLVLGLVAMVALAAWTALGEELSTKVDCSADAIAGAGGGPCGVGGDGSPPGAGGEAPVFYGHNPDPHPGPGELAYASYLSTPFRGYLGRGDQPGWTPTDRTYGSEYRTVRGRAFVRGKGDAALVDANDVKQGNLADCYLLASLAAIAQTNPSLISGAVQPTRDGRYEVTFYDGPGRSSSHTYTVRPTFLIGRNGRATYARSGDYGAPAHELWPMLVEKGWAWHKGSYTAIGKSGTAAEVLAALTGNRAQVMGGTVAQDRSGWGPDFDRVADGFERGLAIVVGSRQSGRDPLFANQTLIQGHDYYVKKIDRRTGEITLGNTFGWGQDREDVTLTREQFTRAFSMVTMVDAKHPATQHRTSSSG